jgi:hypothetical protein
LPILATFQFDVAHFWVNKSLSMMWVQWCGCRRVKNVKWLGQINIVTYKVI